MTVNKSNLRITKLAAGLSLAISLMGVQAHVFAKTAGVATVTSCADDNSSGTLRHVVAGAARGQQVDLSRLSCANDTIALTQGEIVIERDVTLSGASGRGLTISSSAGRILHSTATSLSIVDLTVSGGNVHTTSDDAEGGCILAAGRVSLTGSTVADCAVNSTGAGARGGAISAQSVSLVNSKVTGSSAIASGYYQVARGGGVYAAGLSCVDSTLSGNRVAGDSGNGYGQGGGALILNGDVDLSRCTIDSNVAGQGGALMQFVFRGYAPITRIQNSTISGNAATFASAGVEVFCPECAPQPVQLLNSTLVFNSSPTSYGDGLITNGSVVAQSSIIARNGLGNSTDGDLFATELNGADNLIMQTNVKTERGVVAIKRDPALMPLADNGGPTWTHGLSIFSPARNSGNNHAGQTTDQRGNGFQRTTFGLVDIGAFQVQPAAK